MDPLHINIFYQYLVDCLLSFIIHLLFLIHNLKLLIFYMDDLEYMATLNYIHYIYELCIIIYIVVYTLCVSLLNLCCDFSMFSLFDKHFFIIIKVKYSFYYTLFDPFAFLSVLPLSIK